MGLAPRLRQAGAGVGQVSGTATWWANRKSRLGQQISARKPPHLPGREWWCDPPTTIPQPEHIEYVVQFQQQVMQRPNGRDRQNLLQACGGWLRAARSLLHETFEDVKHGDLMTTDGLFLAVNQLVLAMTGKAIAGGFRLTERDQKVIDALHARSHRLAKDRAVEASKRVSIHPTLYRAEPVHAPRRRLKATP